MILEQQFPSYGSCCSFFIPLPTYKPRQVMNTLDAVNQLLSSIGEAPVSELEVGNPEVDLALATLEQTNQEVQAERWHFNTEYNYSLPNSGGQVVVPSNVLFIQINKDRLSSNLDLCEREGKLYDRVSHSYNFTTSPVSVDVVWSFPFDSLPRPFQLYIAVKASRTFIARSQGSKEMMQLAMVDETRLRANCVAYDTDEQELTMAVGMDRRQYRSTYQVLDAIWRR